PYTSLTPTHPPHVHSLLLFFNDTAPTEIYTLSLHDALPICLRRILDRDRDGLRDRRGHGRGGRLGRMRRMRDAGGARERERGDRSEEHTSELQSLTNIVCRLLL